MIKVLEKTNKPVNQEFQIKIYLSKMGKRTPLVFQWWGIHASTAGSRASIPAQGTETLCATHGLYIYIYIYIYIEREREREREKGNCDIHKQVKARGSLEQPSRRCWRGSPSGNERTPDSEHKQYEQTPPLKVTTKLNVKVNIIELLVYIYYFPYNVKGKRVKQHLYCSYLC